MSTTENTADKKKRRAEHSTDYVPLLFLAAFLSAFVVLLTIVGVSSYMSQKNFPEDVATIEHAICDTGNSSSYVLFNDEQLRKGYSSSDFSGVAAVGFHRSNDGAHDVWQPVNHELNVLSERSHYGDTYDKPLNVRDVTCENK